MMHLTKQQLQHFLVGPWPARAVSALLICLIVWWTTTNVLPMFVERKTVDTPITVIKEIKVKEKLSFTNLELFGSIEKSQHHKPSNTARPTKLNLTLRGIIATDDPTEGVAQIQNENKEERHFVVNDSVFNKATLAEIYPDHVILLHNGHRETLLLPEKFLNLQHFSVEKQKTQRKKTATEYLNIFLNSSGEEKMKLFGFDTAYRHGGFFGFVIKALGPKGIEMMNILGVQDGDVIVVVNGLRFSESLEAAQQLKELKHATSVDVIIDRNGEEIPFHVEFDSPIADKVDIGNATSDLPGGTDESTKPNISNSSARQPYQNKITEDGKVDRSGFTQSLIDSRDEDDDEDFEPDWNDTPEAEEYRLKQQERTTGAPLPVEIDH